MKAIASSDRGFTLLEVMVALAIVATSLVALLGLINRSVTINDRLQQTTRATLLAQSKMSEIELAANNGGSLDAEEGFFADPFESFHWRTHYESTPLPQLQTVTVVVAWGDEKKNEAVDLTSFVLQGGE
ncbi:MAG: type II secretion system protein GspI [Desulfuromonas sp.]|nr:MAG: type II secretion system protein GspI [Desulfuromonas sp.]